MYPPMNFITKKLIFVKTKDTWILLILMQYYIVKTGIIR